MRSVKAQRQDSQWRDYLSYASQEAVNRERVDTIESISGREVLEYVTKTLDILDQISDQISDECKAILRTVLQWSEVAKGGSSSQRARWREQGYPLDIHNIASAEIFDASMPKDYPNKKIIYTLIRTHGLIGQCVRGETSVSENYPLRIVKQAMPQEFSICLRVLNQCIIQAADPELWLDIQNNVYGLIYRLNNNDYTEFYSTKQRCLKLSRTLTDLTPEELEFMETEVFPKYQLWYFDSATKAFSKDQIMTLLRTILSLPKSQYVHYINFKPLADSIYYDYELKKHINVYKSRIIEKFLDTNSSDYVHLDCRLNNGILLIGFTFSQVCIKLVDFCVEAERSNLLSFEKSIGVLYEILGFKRDKFDRLNNEEKYLKTMNEAAESKRSLALEAVGQTVVDVGSGGGVMLDLLEELYPDRRIIGTDISANVLIELEKKRKKDQHNWTTFRHNFVDGPLPWKADTIIFSSILHEIFSYTETENGKFDIESVKKALKNAYDSLNPGGRLLIRDGVKTIGDDQLTLELLSKDSLIFFKNYIHDFRGLKDVDWNISLNQHSNCSATVTGNVNILREFLYTYTWGQESYAHEVQEQFGYFTLPQFVDYLGSLGAYVIKAESFLEEGYYEHLHKTIGLDKNEYPDSNCVIICVK